MARRKQFLVEKGYYSSRRRQCVRIACVLGPCLLFLFIFHIIVPVTFNTWSTTYTTTSGGGGGGGSSSNDTISSSNTVRSSSSSMENLGLRGKVEDTRSDAPDHVTESEPTPSGDGASNGEKRSLKECDIFEGKWVRDYRPQFYPPGSCPYVDMMLDCFRNGRPEEDYLYWRWQPKHCDIPRMNATDFLERLRGQRLVLVGDSLNRNMFESLICILRASVPNKKRVFEISGTIDLKKRPYSSVKFAVRLENLLDTSLKNSCLTMSLQDYNCSVEFIRANFLVKLNQTAGQKNYKVRLDLIEDSSSIYREADILIFNTGRWWGNPRWEYAFQEGEHVYRALPFMDACEKGMRTWAEWMDRNINTSRTQVFYRGFSPNHSSARQWKSHGKCLKETEPIYNETFLGRYPDFSILAEKILKEMKTPITFLNVSRLADYRKDGHTSIYVKKYKDEKEKGDAIKTQDCGHWCLPGVPDVWNELLYASLLKIGRGSWESSV